MSDIKKQVELMERFGNHLQSILDKIEVPFVMSEITEAIKDAQIKTLKDALYIQHFERSDDGK